MVEFVVIPKDLTNFLEIATNRCDDVEDVAACVDMFIIAVNSLNVLNITVLRSKLIQHCLDYHEMND